MTLGAIHDAVRRVVLDMAPLRPEAVDGSTSLIEGLGYDSLGLIELATALEEEFALEAMAMDDSGDVRTISDVEQFVGALLHAGR